MRAPRPCSRPPTGSTRADAPSGAREPAAAASVAAPPAAEPAPSGPARPQRLEATATVATTTVQGALTRSEVDRALQRVVPSFRACYATAARSAGRNAPATLKLTFTLDETGLAQSAEAAAAALPGLSDCLREAARQVRTQVRPDVGVVYVTAAVTFAPLGP